MQHPLFVSTRNVVCTYLRIGNLTSYNFQRSLGADSDLFRCVSSLVLLVPTPLPPVGGFVAAPGVRSSPLRAE